MDLAEYPLFRRDLWQDPLTKNEVVTDYQIDPLDHPMNPTEPNSNVPSSDHFPIIQDSNEAAPSSLTERVTEKTWQLLDETISPSDLDQLNRDLITSAEARKAYLNAVNLHLGLKDFFEGQRDR